MNCIDQVVHDQYTIIHGDSAEVMTAIPSDSVGFSVFSPPFASLFTYSASDRDMGNCRSEAEFGAHFGFLVEQIMRVCQPGRNISVHCMDIPASVTKHGHIGLIDFSGQIRALFERFGAIYHSRVTIWKDPVTQMQRTKALGLLYKQVKKDAVMSRQGLPDYVLTFRKPGKNPVPVAHTDIPLPEWQELASPVWMDINPSDTLQHRSVRADEDERHICPLQLPVIRRLVKLWSVPGDVVLSPFAGIGSEGVVALELGRKFLGIELKAEYYAQAAANLADAVRPASTAQPGLFGGGG